MVGTGASQTFTLDAAAQYIRRHFPIISGIRSHARIEYQKVGQEVSMPPDPPRYMRKHLEYLMVPLIGYAILGNDQAQHYFSPLPATGIGGPLWTSSAQFKFSEIVLAMQLLVHSQCVTITPDDILSHAWNASMDG